MNPALRMSWSFSGWPRKIQLWFTVFQGTLYPFLCCHVYAIRLYVQSFTWTYLEDLFGLYLVHLFPLSAWTLNMGTVFFNLCSPRSAAQTVWHKCFFECCFTENNPYIFKCLFFFLKLTKTDFLGLWATWNEFTYLLYRLCCNAFIWHSSSFSTAYENVCTFQFLCRHAYGS